MSAGIPQQTCSGAQATVHKLKSMMNKIITSYTSDNTLKKPHIDKSRYDEWYQKSLSHPDAFWKERAHEFLDWQQDFHTVSKTDMACGKVSWFEGGKLNVAVNCIDRHLAEHADKTAIIWEGDSPDESEEISYAKLAREVGLFANALRARGVKKGDRVCVYMPMIPQAAYAMLACARIGAIHSVVFGGFSPEALKDRILDADCRVVVTADEGLRGGKTIALKANVDKAVEQCPCVETVFVVKRTGGKVDWDSARDVWWHTICAEQSPVCEPEWMDAEDPLFILYTSGSTGKPKGVLHSTAGYLLYTAMTHRYVFDYQEGEVYWCTADVGWITGHSYIVYGPLANAACTLMFEGVPTYPDASRCWDICDKYQVASFYTAPTALRALMAQGDDFVKRSSRSSLKVLGTVGEPINPEVWEWYHKVVGNTRCPIVDTWWQTETGGHMLTPLPGATALKPGSATLPFFGIEPVLLDKDGQELHGEAQGALAIKRSWPSQIRTVYGDHDRLVDTYYKAFPGYYFTGDGARRDADGYYWITGRMDDVLNVSGHRMGTAEIESALVLHEDIAEAAVVGYPHDIKGEGIYAYVTPMNGIEPSDALKQELIALCVQEIGPIAKPDLIQWSSALPKTRSGKIMRRILRKIAANQADEIGDTSTLADPGSVALLVEQRLNQ